MAVIWPLVGISAGFVLCQRPIPGKANSPLRMSSPVTISGLLALFLFAASVVLSLQASQGLPQRGDLCGHGSCPGLLKQGRHPTLGYFMELPVPVTLDILPPVSMRDQNLILISTA